MRIGIIQNPTIYYITSKNITSYKNQVKTN